MRQTYYGKLGIPSTATQAEIRAAYGRQIERVRCGEVPASLEPEIEQAYATLGNPSSRLSYDVELASRSAVPLAELVSSRSLALVAGMVAGAALSGILLLAVLPTGRPARLTPPTGSAGSTMTVSAPLPSAAPQRVTALQIDASKASDATIGGLLTPAPASASPADEQSPAPVESPPPGAVMTAIAPAPPPVRVVAAPRAPARPIAYYQPPAAPSVETVAAPEAPADQTATAPDEAASVEESPPVVVSAPRTPPVLLSAPFGGQRVSLRVPGWYCSDTSGGQIFVTAGTPLPPGVSC
jgi:hypothetical protein